MSRVPVIRGVRPVIGSNLQAPMALGDLTRGVNTILVDRGDVHQISPEKAGWQLRALGFHTDFTAGGRKGLALSEADRIKIHSLAREFEVRSVQGGSITR